MTTYPENSKWECIDKHGRRGYILLFRKGEKFDMWTYGWRYADGSGGTVDWTTSYATAKKLHRVQGRFKRVK